MLADHRPFMHPRRGPHRETRAHRWWGSWEVVGVRDDESAFGLEVGRRAALHGRLWEGFASVVRHAVERAAKEAEGKLFA